MSVKTSVTVPRWARSAHRARRARRRSPPRASSERPPRRRRPRRRRREPRGPSARCPRETRVRRRERESLLLLASPWARPASRAARVWSSATAARPSRQYDPRSGTYLDEAEPLAESCRRQARFARRNQCEPESSPARGPRDHWSPRRVATSTHPSSLSRARAISPPLQRELAEIRGYGEDELVVTQLPRSRQRPRAVGRPRFPGRRSPTHSARGRSEQRLPIARRRRHGRSRAAAPRTSPRRQSHRGRTRRSRPHTSTLIRRRESARLESASASIRNPTPFCNRSPLSGQKRISAPAKRTSLVGSG